MTSPAVTALIHALSAQTPAPSPSPDQQLTIYTVTPGIGGFLAFFVLALAAWVLFRSMAKHMRTVDRNAAARGETPVRRGIDVAPASDADDARARGGSSDGAPDGPPLEDDGTRPAGSATGTDPYPSAPRPPTP
ncbi:hypothetical protein [Georgenia wangjunii]|uniref:hypothetical protein n=1 Tax=Georgenia wangjunii TaxID=3117730 RepID=UPI002F25FFB2